MYRTIFAAAVLSAALGGCSSTKKVPSPTAPDSIPPPPVSSSKSPQPVVATEPASGAVANPR